MMRSYRRVRSEVLGRALAALSLCSCTQHSLIGSVDSDAGSADARTAGDDDGSAPERDASAPIASIDECDPSRIGIGAPELSALRQANDPSGLDALYPYDGTVFPRGIGAPLLQWRGPSAQFVRVRMSSLSFHYEGCFAATADGELAIAPRIWLAAEQNSQGARDTVLIELSLLSGGRARGPLRTRVNLSTTRALGSVHYQTYGSKLDSSLAVGSVMRVPLGGTAEPLLGNDSCSGCHGVAAGGKLLIASINAMGRSYTLRAGSVVGAAGSIMNLPGAEFAAVEPSGRYYIASAHPVNANLVALPSFGGQAQMSAALYSTELGFGVPSSGVPAGTMMPTFSADGRLVAFNDYDDAEGHSLSLATFDVSTPKLSSPRRIFVDGARYPGWPGFLPDGRRVVFALGSATNFGGGGALLFGKTEPSKPSDLMLVDTTTGESSVMWRSVGYQSAADAAAQRTYLPFGTAEAGYNYYPTVMATSGGAHSFVCFDSIRHYGRRGLKRAIWCAGVASADDAQEDASAPAFYLPGQESDTANFRPVAVADAP